MQSLWEVEVVVGGGREGGISSNIDSTAGNHVRGVTRIFRDRRQLVIA